MGVKETAQKVLQQKLYKSAYSRAWFTLWGISLKEIQVSFRQFFTWKYPIRSFLRTLSAIHEALLRLVLGRSAKISFSYTGEDRILESMYKPLITETGYYVDVGCNHPTLFSNTYSFYKRGWRGVCIDANQKLIDNYKLWRPRDVAICALVSDTEQLRDYFIVENNVLSTTEEKFLETYEKQGLRIQKKQILSRTLTSILDEANAPANIDILSIDVEEHDLQAIKSLDLKKYKPKLIVIEDETFDILHPETNAIYTFLTSNGFRLEGYVLKNLYFQNISTSSLQSSSE